MQVSFKTPVLLPSTVAIATATDGADWLLDVRNAKSGKPHLSGTVRGVLIGIVRSCALEESPLPRSNSRLTMTGDGARSAARQRVVLYIAGAGRSGSTLLRIFSAPFRE